MEGVRDRKIPLFFVVDMAFMLLFFCNQDNAAKNLCFFN